MDATPTKRGGKWGQSTVQRILANPIYVGKVRFDVDGEHPTLIEPEVWAKVEAMMSSRPERRGRPTTGSFLFRGGLLRCGICDWALSPRFDGEREYYYCNGRRQLGPKACHMPSIRRAVVDEAVFDYFQKVVLDLEATKASIDSVRSTKADELQPREPSARQPRRWSASSATRSTAPSRPSSGTGWKASSRRNTRRRRPRSNG